MKVPFQNVVADALTSPLPADRLAWLFRLRILIPAISVAARFGVADHIGDAPMSADDIAHAVRAHPRTLFRLLRCLASAGIFEELPGERFVHTPLSRVLRSDDACSMADFAKMYTAEWMVRALDGLEYSVRTGEGCLARALGKPGYEWLAEHPDEAQIVDRAMSAYSRTMERGLADALDLTSVRRVVDVGGGDGTFLLELLGKYPTVSGVVAELPRVIGRARDRIVASGLGERTSAIETDMFEAVPGGADAYIVKRVLHNWNDEKAAQVLRRLRAAVAPSGRIIIIDSMIPASGRSLYSTLGDLQELGLGGASERTEREFRALCAAASLRVVRIDYPSEYTAIVYSVPTQ